MLLERLYRFRLSLMLTAVGVLAAILRLVGLSQPKALVFDELYYAREAYSLAHMGYEGSWSGDNQAFAHGDFSGLNISAEHVVHPPLGKWIIALGIKGFGPTPFGWRVSAAVVGTLTCVLLALIAYRLFRSVLWGGVAGLFLAIDGQHIVVSRTALLDIFLTFFVVVAFGFLLLDRARNRKVLARRVAQRRERLGLAEGAPLPGFRPGVGFRGWRFAAIVALGLATGVKWSGIYFAGAFLILSAVWDIVDRKRAGVLLYIPVAIVRSIFPALFMTIVFLPTVYVASWASWFASNDSYWRHWAGLHVDQGEQWLPPTARSFLAYHEEMWQFHTSLTYSNGITHPYGANPWGFIIQERPTAFYWDKVDVGEGTPPATTATVSAITALGNPALWWAGAVAFLWATARAIFRKDVLAWTVIIGTLGGWIPWLIIPDRVMFTFYSVSFAPWVMLTLVWALRRIAQPPRLKGKWSAPGGYAVGAFIALAILLSGFFLPIWTGQWIPYNYWLAHMWLGSVWI